MKQVLTEYDSMVAVTHGLFLTVFFKDMLNLNIQNVGDGGYVLTEIKDQKFTVVKMDGIVLE